MNICYAGPMFDYSGYGEANRNFVNALHSVGVNMRVQSVSYVLDHADFGEIGRLCKQLISNDINYKIKVLHVTPDQYRKFMEPDCYHIGHLFWETSKLPPEFATAANLMDEIWTGSETNAKAIRDSGVTKPIFVCPEAIENNSEKMEPYIIPYQEGFLFYSIFEWTERKNPKALIRAFYEEFGKDEPVSLLVKTYFDSFNDKHSQYVMHELHRLKREYGANSARVLLYKYLMDRHQVMRLHQSADCFVTAHRGEGWGIPIVEAMSYGKPVITTAYNGVNDYLSPKEAFLVPYSLVPVTNMQRNDQWYRPDQTWAEVSIEELRRNMRYVFEHQKEAKKIGKQAQKFVRQRFSYKAVGTLLKDRLAEIEKGLA